MSTTPDLLFKPTKILLPLDFSPSSQAALEAATVFAKQFHSQLYLVHVISESPDFNGSDFSPETSVLQERRSEVDRKLIQCQASLKQQGVDARFSIETGNDIVSNLLQVIAREHLDMVIISTHGLSGWRPIVFGSITEKMIKLVQCPLLLLHSAQAKVTSEKLPTKILVNVSQKADASESNRIIKAAEASALTMSQRRQLDVDAENASERAGITEERYDKNNSIFTK